MSTEIEWCLRITLYLEKITLVQEEYYIDMGQQFVLDQ